MQPEMSQPVPAKKVWKQNHVKHEGVYQIIVILWRRQQLKSRGQKKPYYFSVSYQPPCDSMAAVNFSTNDFELGFMRESDTRNRKPPVVWTWPFDGKPRPLDQ